MGSSSLSARSGSIAPRTPVSLPSKMPSKAPDQPVTGADGNSLQVPQAVIAQAEAAASNTTTADPQAVRESARRQTVTAAGPSDPGFVTYANQSNSFTIVQLKDCQAIRIIRPEEDV